MTTAWNPSAAHPWASMKNGRLTADRQCVIFHIYRPWMYPEIELLIRRIVLMRFFLLTFGGEFLGIWASHDSAPRNFHHPLWGVQSNGFYSWRFKWGFCSWKQLKRLEMTFTAPIMPMKWIYFLICLVFTCFVAVKSCNDDHDRLFQATSRWQDSIHRHISCDMDFCRCFLVKKNLTALAGVLAVFTSLGKVSSCLLFRKGL